MQASLQEAYIAQNTAKMNVERAMEQKNESENVFAGLQMENREIESQLREIAENKDKITEELTVGKGAGGTDRGGERRIPEDVWMRMRAGGRSRRRTGSVRSAVNSNPCTQKARVCSADNLERIER